MIHVFAVLLLCGLRSPSQETELEDHILENQLACVPLPSTANCLLRAKCGFSPSFLEKKSAIIPHQQPTDTSLSGKLLSAVIWNVNLDPYWLLCKKYFQRTQFISWNGNSNKQKWIHTRRKLDEKDKGETLAYWQSVTEIMTNDDINRTATKGNF